MISLSKIAVYTKNLSVTISQSSFFKPHYQGEFFSRILKSAPFVEHHV